MWTLCIIAALLGLEKLRYILSYLCVFIVLFVLLCGGYAALTSEVGPFAGSANVDQYAAAGKVLRANVFGFRNPYLSGVSSAGLLIGSGFAWTSATGGLCGSRKEAALSGIFSSMFYYAATAVVVYLVLTAMNHIAGAEVPLLAVVQFFVPKLSAVYSRLCRIFRGRHCKHRIRDFCRALHFTPLRMGKGCFRCMIYVGSEGYS